jgi:hypothetical protein
VGPRVGQREAEPHGRLRLERERVAGLGLRERLAHLALGGVHLAQAPERLRDEHAERGDLVGQPRRPRVVEQRAAGREALGGGGAAGQAHALAHAPGGEHELGGRPLGVVSERGDHGVAVGLGAAVRAADLVHGRLAPGHLGALARGAGVAAGDVEERRGLRRGVGGRRARAAVEGRAEGVGGQAGAVEVGGHGGRRAAGAGARRARLERPPDAFVHAPPPQRVQAVAQHAGIERVREGERGAARGGRGEHAGLEGRVERVAHGRVGLVGGGGERLGVEVAAQHRRPRPARAGRGAAPGRRGGRARGAWRRQGRLGQLGGGRLGRPGRWRRGAPGGGRGGGCGARRGVEHPAAVLLPQPPVGEECAHGLDGEQRVPGTQRLHVGQQRGVGRLAAEGRAEPPGQLVRREAAEGKLGRPALAQDPRDARLGGGVQLVAAERGAEQHRAPLHPVEQHLQHAPRRGVGPVQVVEHHGHRAPRGGARQGGVERVDEGERLERGGAGGRAAAGAGVGVRHGQRAPRPRPREPGARGRGEHVGPRAAHGARVALHPAPGQQPPAAHGQVGGELPQQRALARARLAGDQHQGRLAPRGAVEQRAQPLALRRAPGEAVQQRARRAGAGRARGAAADTASRPARLES